MATGGTPLARVLVILAMLAAPAAILTLDGVAIAQDGGADALLKDGLEKLRAGQYNEAITVLRQALAAEPSSEQVQAALGRAEYGALLGLLASGQEGANLAKALLDRAMPELPDLPFDEAELKKLVQTAVTSDDYTARFDAAMTLARVYGEFAVPDLVTYLATSNSDYKVNAHITLMSRIGRDAVLPLDEALHSDNAEVRRMVAIELGTIGDERSLAALAEAAASDSDESARSEAAQALAKLREKYPETEGMTPSDLYLRLARLFYAGNYRVMSYADRPLVLWYWQDGLQGMPVPRHLYVLKLAEEASYDALRVDPANAAARAMLARVLASEKIASDVVTATGGGDELGESFAQGLAHTRGIVAAMGAATLGRALNDCIDEADQPTAAVLLDAMSAVYQSTDFTMEHPVVRATRDTNANVRLASVEAVLRFNKHRRISAFPDPDGFMSLVARSVGEIVPRHILVVDGNDERRNKMLHELDQARYIAYDARTGSDGYVRAVRFPGLDLIVASANLGDMETLELLDKLKENERTANIPVLVVGDAAQAADESWRQLYEGKAASVTGVPSGPGLPAEAFQAAVASSLADRSMEAQQRYGFSSSILDALATTDTENALFPWAALTDTLSALLTQADLPSDPPVRMNALRAMTNIGDPAALDALVTFFGSDAEAAQRAEAGRAIAAICRNVQMGFSPEQFQTMLTGTGDADDAVRTAAFDALGAAALDAEQALAVAVTNRPGAAGAGS